MFQNNVARKRKNCAHTQRLSIPRINLQQKLIFRMGGGGGEVRVILTCNKEKIPIKPDCHKICDFLWSSTLAMLTCISQDMLATIILFWGFLKIKWQPCKNFVATLQKIQWQPCKKVKPLRSQSDGFSKNIFFQILHVIGQKL